MHILVCNDDGLASPGLKAAVEAVLGLGSVTVVAPTRQQTGTGRSLSWKMNESLRPSVFCVLGRRVPAYCADAPPALLIEHALVTLFRHRPPDLVVSGINYGENLGSIVTASGTVGAALQAASFNIPALAVSRQTDIAHHTTYADLNWEGAQHFTRYFSKKLLRQQMPPDVHVLNVNVPAVAHRRTAWRMTCLSDQSYFAYALPRASKRSKFGDARVHIAVDYQTLKKDSDIHALARDGVVSVTPLSLDMTSRVDRAVLRSRLRR
jgi:5'-nucleotidase